MDLSKSPEVVSVKSVQPFPSLCCKREERGREIGEREGENFSLRGLFVPEQVTRSSFSSISLALLPPSVAGERREGERKERGREKCQP